MALPSSDVARVTDPVRLFVVAGELSGDLLGAHLVGALQKKVGVELSGVGGPELEAEGLRSLFPMRDLAVMGIADVVARFPLLWWRVRQTVDAIIRSRPDIVVMIDSQLFASTVAQRVRKAGYRGPMILYVAPSVWAFRPERARDLVGLFDEILAIYHFEPKVLSDLGGPPTTYVGHPALGRYSMREGTPAKGPLLLLPGSRAGELRRHLPLMAGIAEALSAHPRVSELVLPTPSIEADKVRAAAAYWPVPVRVVTDAAEKAQAFRDAVAAAAAAGTVTLELALSGVPMAVTYVGDRQQVRRWLSVDRPFTALPNILGQKRIVFDGVVEKPNADEMIAELRRLLDRPELASRQVEEFAAMARLMAIGVVDPSERVLAHLPQRLSMGT
jgi:lipid-A-disaccharide synthase